jgi:hypothetical protein
VIGTTVVLAATLIWVMRPPPRPIRSTAAPAAKSVAAERAPTSKLARAVGSWLDVDPLQDELRALKADTLHGAAIAFQIADSHRRQ